MLSAKFFTTKIIDANSKVAKMLLVDRIYLKTSYSQCDLSLWSTRFNLKQCTHGYYPLLKDRSSKMCLCLSYLLARKRWAVEGLT